LPTRTTPDDFAEALDACARRLHALTFPVLIAPRQPMEDIPTAEHVEWAVHVYIWCLVAHARQLIESYALLLRLGHRPTTFFVGRGLFELAGHATLVAREVREAVGRGDFKTAWTWLEAANMGNREMCERGIKTTDGKDWTEPIHVMDDVRAIGDFLSGSRKEREAQALELYDVLAEFCHPNMGAFMQYCQFEDRAEGIYMRLRYSPADYVAIPEVSIAISLALHAATTLLGIHGRHPTLSTAIAAAADEFNRAREEAERDEDQ
jgi:hypothetical protein